MNMNTKVEEICAVSPNIPSLVKVAAIEHGFQTQARERKHTADISSHE